MEIITALDHGVAVFCEKPMFWRRGIDLEEIENNLTQILNHKHRCVFVNTCNDHFIERIIGDTTISNDIQSFYFRFYTQGNNSGYDIASDLLPHGLSLLLFLFGTRIISSIKQVALSHTYCCQFRYGDCKVEFDFQELRNGPKDMAFKINEHEFSRIQRGYGTTYRVYLSDKKDSRIMELHDPFQVAVKRFIDFCRGDSRKGPDDFDIHATNMRLMADILLEDSK